MDQKRNSGVDYPLTNKVDYIGAMRRYFVRLHLQFAGFEITQSRFLYGENLETAKEEINLGEGWKCVRVEVLDERASVLTKERLLEL